MINRSAILLSLIFVCWPAQGQPLELNATIYLQVDGTTEVLLDGTTGGSFEFHSWEKHDNYQGEPVNILVGLTKPSEIWIKAWLGDSSTRLSPDDELIVDETIDASSMMASTTPIHSFANGAKIFVNTTPRLATLKPESVSLDAVTMGLDYLCLKNASVVLDDTFQLGRISGFGARFTIDVPDFNLVTFSLRQFDGYEPVGEYYKGLITIPLGENELSINAVRFGPASQYLMGPFTVYGSLDPTEVGPATARKNAKDRVRRKASAAKTDRMIAHIDSMPFAPVNRITSDLMVMPTPQLEALIGPWGTGLEECGR